MADVSTDGGNGPALDPHARQALLTDFFKHLIKIAMSQSRLKHAHRVLQGTLWKTGDSGMAFLVYGGDMCWITDSHRASGLPDSQDGVWGDPSRTL